MEKSTKIPVLGLISGLITLAKNGATLFLSRQQLTALELSQARDRLLKQALILALAIGALWLAFACGTGLIVYLSWDRLGWKILCILTLAFTLMAAGLLLYARAMFRQGQPPQPTTQLAAQPEISPRHDIPTLCVGLVVATLIALAKRRKSA